MYLTLLKSVVVDALQQTFNSTDRNPNFQDLRVSIEYPLDQQSYPSVWVNYDDTDSLQIAGIGHQEFVLDATTGETHAVTRWLFSGTVTLTVVALSSLERDGLYDELVRIFAFSRIQQETPALPRPAGAATTSSRSAATGTRLRPHGDRPPPPAPRGGPRTRSSTRSRSASTWRANSSLTGGPTP